MVGVPKYVLVCPKYAFGQFFLDCFALPPNLLIRILPPQIPVRLFCSSRRLPGGQQAVRWRSFGRSPAPRCAPPCSLRRGDKAPADILSVSIPSLSLSLSPCSFFSLSPSSPEKHRAPSRRAADSHRPGLRGALLKIPHVARVLQNQGIEASLLGIKRTVVFFPSSGRSSPVSIRGRSLFPVLAEPTYSSRSAFWFNPSKESTRPFVVPCPQLCTSSMCRFLSVPPPCLLSGRRYPAQQL